MCVFERVAVVRAMCVWLKELHVCVCVCAGHEMISRLVLCVPLVMCCT